MNLDFSQCQGPDHARVYVQTHRAYRKLKRANLAFRSECALKCAQYLFDEMIGENEHNDFEGIKRRDIKVTVDAIVDCIFGLSCVE